MLTDNLLTVRDVEERLSMVYAHAVAARAGYVIALHDLDRDGIDLRIQAGGAMRPALDLQMKATFNLRQSDGESFRFPLPVHNYNSLRMRTQTPRLLVVLHLPRDERQWVTITDEELVIRRCAYWLNLRDWEETVNEHSITVAIPKGNRFDVTGLRALMEQSRTGKIQ